MAHSDRMILLRKAYRGHYIEIRPVPAGLLPVSSAAREAQIWIDGRALDTAFPCARASVLPALLRVAQERIDQTPEGVHSHQA